METRYNSKPDPVKPSDLFGPPALKRRRDRTGDPVEDVLRELPPYVASMTRDQRIAYMKAYTLAFENPSLAITIRRAVEAGLSDAAYEAGRART